MDWDRREGFILGLNLLLWCVNVSPSMGHLLWDCTPGMVLEGAFDPAFGDGEVSFHLPKLLQSWGGPNEPNSISLSPPNSTLVLPIPTTTLSPILGCVRGAPRSLCKTATGIPKGASRVLGRRDGGCCCPRAPQLSLVCSHREPQAAPADPQWGEALCLRPLPAPVRRPRGAAAARPHPYG